MMRIVAYVTRALLIALAIAVIANEVNDRPRNDRRSTAIIVAVLYLVGAEFLRDLDESR